MSTIPLPKNRYPKPRLKAGGLMEQTIGLLIAEIVTRFIIAESRVDEFFEEEEQNAKRLEADPDAGGFYLTILSDLKIEYSIDASVKVSAVLSLRTQEWSVHPKTGLKAVEKALQQYRLKS